MTHSQNYLKGPKPRPGEFKVPALFRVRFRLGRVGFFVDV